MEKITEFKTPISDGMEIDRENSTLELIRFKPIPLKTYEEISNELVCSNKSVYHGIICTSANYNKLVILNRLFEVAQWLNSHCNVKGPEIYNLYYSKTKGELRIGDWPNSVVVGPRFKTIDLAEKAIQILGKEELIKLFK